VGKWSVAGIVIGKEDRNTRKKICLIGNYITTTPTQTALGLNPGFHGEKPVVANRLSELVIMNLNKMYVIFQMIIVKRQSCPCA
jgi:hypothetical protein